MRKFILFSVFVFASISMFGQSEFNFDVKDSVNLSKDKIYSATKSFIAIYWKSAQNVIQSDDKEAGLIVIKANVVITQRYQVLWLKYVFPYTVKLYMKNNKYRIVIDNVYCESAYCDDTKWPLLPITFEYPGYFKTSLVKDRYVQIMTELQSRIAEIVNSYKDSIRNYKSSSEDW